MKCRKRIILNGYRVQYVDLRETKPRTPKELIHVVDKAWLDALCLLGRNIADNIREQYERAGYKVFTVEPIKPKRVVELDLCQLWKQPIRPAAVTTTTEEDTAQ
jgi:hypothetical protein